MALTAKTSEILRKIRSMKKVLVIFGTRPEAIKLAPVINELRKLTESFEVKICVTGQHREMLHQVLQLFELTPDFDLKIMKEGQTLEDVVAQSMLGIRDVLKESPADVLLVQGDTATTMAGSLVGYFNKVQVAHVEAGLRTGNIYSPWPEEANRRIVGVVANWHFAATEGARANLLAEGVQSESILVTGNTVIDSLLLVRSKIESDASLNHALYEKFSYIEKNKKLVLVTNHRRENFGGGIENVLHAIARLADHFPELQFVFPVHPNPNILEPAKEILSSRSSIHLIEPLDYVSFVYLMGRSYLIITDSGGIQEEAPALSKPVVLTRNTTERQEAVNSGTVKMVGTDPNAVFNAVALLLTDDREYERMSECSNPYGDGNAAKKIADFLRHL